MKNLKILGVLFIALSFFACEQEQINSENLDSEVSEVKFIHIDESGDIQYLKEKPQSFKNLTKNSHTETAYRTYDNSNDFENDCSVGNVIPFSSNRVALFGIFTYVSFDVNNPTGSTLIFTASNNNGVFYEETFTETNFYIGFASDDVNHAQLESLDGVVFDFVISFDICEYITDSDGDGVPDDEDLMPNSNMEETVMIDGCDSSVDNIALGDGIMLSDKIDELEAGSYRNHGKYVRATAQYLAGLVNEGVITIEEKDAIMTCAGSSSIG